MAYRIAEKAIRFRHADYNPDRAQKLISSSMSRRLSICNISSKFMHAFLSNLADRQTDKQTRAKSFTSSFIGGKKNKPSTFEHVMTRRPRAITRFLCMCDKGMIALILETIDKCSQWKSMRHLAHLIGEDSAAKWNDMINYLYLLLGMSLVRSVSKKLVGIMIKYGRCS